MEEEIKKEEVQEKEKEEKEEEEEKEKPIDKMTAKELREIALKIPDITGVHAMKKAELLKVVKEARGITEEAPAKKRKERVSKEAVSVKELKQKIIQLKGEKEAAREARDKKKINMFRRRINRLKKRSRKVAQA